MDVDTLYTVFMHARVLLFVSLKIALQGHTITEILGVISIQCTCVCVCVCVCVREGNQTRNIEALNICQQYRAQIKHKLLALLELCECWYWLTGAPSKIYTR